MGRRPHPERRAALLAACTDELLRHGLPGLRLAKMAAAAGTSSRMLLYHFTTRDQLVLEALHEARRRQQKLFGELLAPPARGPLRHGADRGMGRDHGARAQALSPAVRPAARLPARPNPMG